MRSRRRRPIRHVGGAVRWRARSSPVTPSSALRAVRSAPGRRRQRWPPGMSRYRRTGCHRWTHCAGCRSSANNWPVLPARTPRANGATRTRRPRRRRRRRSACGPSGRRSCPRCGCRRCGSCLEEQQELIDAISSWADAQRELAERFSDLADRHRQVTDGILATLTPTLDHLDRLAGRAPGAKRATKQAQGPTAGKKRSSR